jgi:hypothetical protein
LIEDKTFTLNIKLLLQGRQKETETKLAANLETIKKWIVFILIYFAL